MFKCCLCGKIYDNEAAAVKCVNKCGREKASLGVFKSKTIKNSNEVSETTYNFSIPDYSFDEIWEKLLELKCPAYVVAQLKKDCLSDWNNKSDREKEDCYNKVVMTMWLYQGSKGVK